MIEMLLTNSNMIVSASASFMWTLNYNIAHSSKVSSIEDRLISICCNSVNNEKMCAVDALRSMSLYGI